MSFMGFGFTGEISKKDIGLISVALITTFGAIFTAGKDTTIAMVFTLLSVLSVIFFVLLFIMDFLNKQSKKDYISRDLSLLFEIENLYLEKPSDEMRKLVLNMHQLFYRRAIFEKEDKLAEVIKDKMEELKK
jgi:Na+-driven multidrug efflux pump